MNNNDRERISAYYDRLVDQHGYSPEARDARSEDSLQARYRVLAGVADLAHKTVLEVGCGFGDLGKFILERFEDVRYLGIDISPRMIAVGSSRHPKLNLRIGDVLNWEPPQPVDVVLAQGIFYLLGPPAEPKMRTLIRRMYDLAGQAVACCTVSSWAERKDADEFYPDPLATLEYCHTITSRLALHHEYLPNDFTLYLYRDGR